MPFRNPMSAKSYEDNAHKILYPCFVQPKVDGVRCITDGQQFWSKNGKLFPKENFKHLQIPKSKYLIDGELSLADHADFEDIVSIVKRVGHPESEKLCFNAFDIMMDRPYFERRKELQIFFTRKQVKILSGSWSRLITRTAVSEKDIKAIHTYFLKCGYEGSMIRDPLAKYMHVRSTALLKWKPLHADEFEIARIVEAKGKDSGTPIFVCVAPVKNAQIKGEFAVFRVRPKGSMEQRQQMWRDRKKLIGKRLTVEYQNLTKYGVPRFPRAKVLRDYE